MWLSHLGRQGLCKPLGSSDTDLLATSGQSLGLSSSWFPIHKLKALGQRLVKICPELVF